MAAFAECGVMPEIIRALDELGWQLPTPIQQEAVPLILGGGDVLGAAETGTGKTGAFGIPILQLIHESLRQETIEKSQAVEGIRPKEQIAFKMSMEDKEPLFTPDPSGLVCSVLSRTAWGGGRSTAGVLSGRYYFEVLCEQMTEKESTVRVGISTAAGLYALGTCPNGFGFGSTGKKSNAGTFSPYGTAFGQGDVIGCKLDLVNRSISFTINGADHGEAFKIAPHLQRSGFYPAICLKASSVRVTFSGGAIPQGFTWIGLAEPRDVVTAAGIESDEASKGATPLCIILEPSRDLAEQTYRCLLDYKKYMPSPSLEAVLLVGGTDVRTDIKALQGGAHIAVGTPGRMEELVTGGRLSCRRVLCRRRARRKAKGENIRIATRAQKEEDAKLRIRVG